MLSMWKRQSQSRYVGPAIAAACPSGEHEGTFERRDNELLTCSGSPP